jgi:uncharacterized protein YbjT (DUF2867 family)
MSRRDRQIMSRILVIGATGLIGSRIAAQLAASGHEVVGVAREIDAAARSGAASILQPRDRKIGQVFFLRSTRS